MADVPWNEVVRCRTSVAGGERPGADLVLEAPVTGILDVPRGVLLDDLLDAPARRSLDEEALDRRRAWHARRGPRLDVGGADLAWIWEMELFAEVFLPEVRTVSGLLRVLDGTPVRAVELHAVDGELARCLAATLPARGVEVRVAGPEPPPPSYPGRLANPWRVPPHRRLTHAAVRALGVPAVPRGDVLLLPYWHLLGVHRRLLGEPGLVPLHDPYRLPAGSAGERIRAALRGGWAGRPGARGHARARRAVAAALRAARAERPAGDPLDALLDARALRMLEQRAAATPAEVATFRRALRRARCAVVPFDGPPDGRTILAAARAEGRPAVLVQHGFASEPNDPDKTESDVIAVWSERDAAAMAPRARGRIVVTGNPGADRLVLAAGGRRGRQTLLLPEYPSRVSARLDTRVTLRSVQVALEGLSAARPGTAVIVRPHPIELDVEGHQRLAAAAGGLDARVDTQTPIEQLIGECDLAVGGVSTAMLQAGSAGVPAVHLHLGATPGPWPFDGAGPMAVATTAEELAAAIPAALEREVDVDAFREALGATPDALDRVVETIREAAEDRVGAEGPPLREHLPAGAAAGRREEAPR